MGGIRLLLENFIKYGFRVDPMEWLIVLTGRNEGDSSYPSIVLAMCEFVFILINFQLRLDFADSSVPIILSILIEKGLSIVS